MKKTISIGAQDFAELREQDCFYIDKTELVKEWWDNRDVVTLITRPRRFGKTLNMSMLECFFSNKYAGRGEELFGDLEIWQDEELRAEQGQWPVIFLSFAGIKYITYEQTKKGINGRITEKFREIRRTLGDGALDDLELEECNAIGPKMDEVTSAVSLKTLCALLERHYGKKPIILLDEYDTPMQEAWMRRALIPRLRKK